MNFNLVRKDFPILKQSIHGHPLAYLDNANTTQKPQVVIDALTDYYEHTNANIHRAVHYLSEKATKAYEHARETVQHFINAPAAKNCIFVKSTTEAINLVATSFGQRFVRAGDEILISALEHHSNIVPWQLLCKQTGANLKVIPMNKQGELELNQIEDYFTPKTKLLAISHASNALGTLNPIKKIIKIAHAHEVPVLVDGAQTAPHIPIDVQDLDCDFFVFSSHKIYGPTGIGVLYGKTSWLEEMPPYQGGGNMISTVSFERTTYNELPFKFEAGTPAIAEAIALAAALDYLTTIGWHAIQKHEEMLLNYAIQALDALPDIRLIGTASERISVISFVMDGVHPHDIASIVDQQGVAVRAGHHCSMPIMDYFKVPATVRASIGIYNTTADIDQLLQALTEVRKIFKK